MIMRVMTCALWVSAASALAGADVYEQRQLQSFEAGPGGWSGGEVVQSEHAVHGEHAYRAVVRRQGDALTWSGQADFSGWLKLKLDTYNAGDPFTVSMVFEDADGNNYRSWYQLVPRGRSMLEYNLRGLVTTVPERDGQVRVVDPTRLTTLRLIVENIPGEAELFIDNIRLSRGPEPRAPMEWFRPEGSGRPVEQVPGNLVANGDFELSLSGWSSWGQWDGGDYRFGTATGEQAYSGTTAATIIAHRPGRGGIYRQLQVPADGGYRVRFAYRGDGATAMRYAIAGQNFDLPVTGQWQIEQRELELSAGQRPFYLYHMSGGTLYLDAVSVAPAEAEVAADAQRPAEPSPPTDQPGNVVEIRGRQTLVNGEPFFPIGFYGVRNVAHLENTGANFAQMRGVGDRRRLDALAEIGVYGTVRLDGVLRGHRPDLVLDIAREFENHPAQFGWYLCDEPDHSVWNVPPHMIRAAHQELHEWSGRHPTITTIMTWHRSMSFQYADTVDILLSAAYTTDETDRVVQAVQWLRDGVAEPKPVWLALQSGWSEDRPVPTLENARVQAYAAIAAGVNGLFWFEMGWPLENQPDQLHELLEVTRELASIHDVLAAADMPAQPQADNDSILVLLKDAPDGPVLIAVNISDQDAGPVRITLPQGVQGHSAAVEFEDRRVAIRGGAVVDRFGPQQRHVYRLGQ